MITQLDLYILNNDNSVAPFPSEAEQIVLYDFAFEAQRMGVAPEITATIQANGSLENSLTTKVFCEYNGERYFLKNLPSSSKENTDPRYAFDLTFVSERTILDNVYMIDAVQGDSNIDRYQSNSTNIVFMGDINEAVARLNAAMTYAGVGYSVVLDEGITTESKRVSFQDKFFTEALQEFVNIHKVPYYYVGKIIHFGWAQTTIPTLKYGDGLLSINKSIRTERIINRATATGSSENIPYYYPNPTPKGTIEVVTNRDDITVDNWYKFSQLPEQSQLRFFQIEDKAVLKNTTVGVRGVPAIDNIDPDSNIDTIMVVPHTINPSDGYWQFALYGRIHLRSPLNIAYNVEVTPSLNIMDDSITTTVLKKQRVALYKMSTDGSLVLDTDSIIDDFDTYFVIRNFPPQEDRFIMVYYTNTSVYNFLLNFTFDVQAQNAPQSGWKIATSDEDRNNAIVDIKKYGLSIGGQPLNGDVISYNVVKKIPFATSLMPPIYRESDGEQRFYNAINGAYEGITFENEYSKENPKEAITTFEDIKPTIVGVTNANGERIDMFAEFAYDLNDSDKTEQTDESSESFIHPYFYAKLRKIDGENGFNLFAQAIESGEMTIEMTSGHCGACKFVIAVDENTQRNLVMVDDNGDLIYDETTGKVKMAHDATGLDRQNDTQNYEVWIALKKDINTFGTVMPMANSTIKPSVGDTFVITNIILPDGYVAKAERDLEEEILNSLVYNNSVKYDLSCDISRIFFTKNIDILNSLNENAIVNIEFNNKIFTRYVSSYKYTKSKEQILPNVSIDLEESITATPISFTNIITSITYPREYIDEDTTNIKEEVKTKWTQDNTKIKQWDEAFSWGDHKKMRYVTHKELTNGLFVTISGEEQSILGDKIFEGQTTFAYGFNLAGIPVRKMDNGSLFIDANVVFGGGATMYGTDTTPAPSIFDGLPIDGRTIKRDGNGALYVDETALSISGGGGVADSVAWANVTGKPKWLQDAGNTKPTYNYSEIQGTPDLSVYFLASNFTKANIKSTLGISDWALASAAPTIKKERLTNFDSATPWTAFYTSFQASNRPAGANYFSGFTLSNIDFQGEDNTYLIQLALSYNGTLHTRYRSAGSFKEWKTLAFTSDIPSLAGYATETFVNTAVNGAKEWVEEQQYLTEITSGMIESVLGYQPYDGDTNRLGFLTSSALNGYATQSWVNTALAGYLPLSGGTLTDALTVKGSGSPLTVHRTQSLASVVKFVNTDGTLGWLGVDVDKTAIFMEASGVIKKLLHSGNYSDYALPKDGTASSATKLATPRTIWGQSFDGTGDVSGRLEDVEFVDFDDWLQMGIIRNDDSSVKSVNIQSAGRPLLINPLGNNVAIGGTTASEKLHVHGNLLTTGKLRILLNKTNSSSSVVANAILNYNISPYGLITRIYSSGNVGLQAQREASDAECFNLLLNHLGGNVAIGGTTANAKLHVHGNLLTEGGITMYSQRSLKNILSYEGLSLEQLSVIKPIRFTWKDGRDNRYHVGGVADDVETVVPEVVYSANDFLTMDYGNAGFYVAASLIKPVLDHEQRIKILEQENKTLREEINQLRQSA